MIVMLMSNEDDEDLDDDKVDDVVANAQDDEFGENIDEMTRKFDDLVQGDDYHHLHWHDCNFYRGS